MKKVFKSIVIAAAAFALCVSFVVQEAKAYTPPTTIIKAGLKYGSSSLDAANLENADGYGSGYEFGYYDSSRNFVFLGAYTNETRISVLRDSNMYYSSSSNAYYKGAVGSVIVGYNHIQLDASYSTYGAAQSAASGYDGAFVKYENGNFYVCIGNYTSAEGAHSAAGSRGISGYSVTSGTSYTVTVVKTGTNQILFEFDCGTSHYLGVRPRSSGIKTRTWFKGYCYYGGFQYSRPYEDSLTVINYVPLEDYVKGVIPYEMSSSWPVEALKAQACCARTYVIANLNKHSSYGFDVCTSEDCQVYFGTNSANDTTDRAVDGTAGKFITYDGKLCETYYASSDGGATENCENVWYAALPYLRGVVDPYEDAVKDIIPGYSWTITYTPESLKERLVNRGYLNYNSTVVGLNVSQRTDVGNVYSIKVSYLDGSGSTKSITFSKEDAKFILNGNSLHFDIESSGNGGSPTNSDIYVNNSFTKLEGNLNSYYAAGSGEAEQLPGSGIFAINGDGQIESIAREEADWAPDTFVIRGTGNGHNLGMSQWGAYSMAMNYGKTYEEIIKFYFTGVEIG